MSAQGKWRVVDVSPGYEPLPVRIYEGAQQIAVVFDSYKAEAIVAAHNAQCEAEPVAQAALAAKDARIAELEKALNYSSDYWENEAQKAHARADRLEAQLRAARAAGTREEGLIPAVPTDEMLRAGYDVLSQLYPPKDNGGQAIGQYIVWEAMYAEAIRARLTPAEPAADTGEKG